MRLLILLLAAPIILSTTAFAQNHKGDISKTLKEYYDAVEKQEINRLLDYMPPEFFQAIPRETLVEAMEKTYNDPTLGMSISDYKLLNTADIVKVDKRLYSKITCEFTLSMNPTAPELDNPDARAYLQQQFELKYGKDKVKANAETGAIDIRATSDSYAIKDPEWDGWKFMEDQAGQEEIIEMIVPEEARKQLN